MDPSMYEGSGHGPWFWVVYLSIAVLTTVGLMGGLLLGIARSYTTPTRPDRTDSGPDTAPAPHHADAA